MEKKEKKKHLETKRREKATQKTKKKRENSDPRESRIGE